MSGPGSTTARGYGRDHQKLRQEWAPLVDAGEVRCHAEVCLMPSRRIPEGAEWDLGHNEDRTEWTGPEHRRCNRSDGARRGNRGRRGRRGRRVVRPARRVWVDPMDL